MTKPILEVKAIIFDRDQEDEYEYKLRKLYEQKTNNEYHVVVLFTDFDSINLVNKNDYPILKVL